MGKLLQQQPTLLHVQIEKDIVYTPEWLADEVVEHFNPSGVCLDPCSGDGVFYNRLPAGSEWCEIEKGRDFFTWSKPVDWAIGNPPYSCLLAWIRHSFTVAENIVYLMPLHRVFASYEFVRDVRKWGGVAEIFIVGTGADVGFPFGHCLGAVHYKKGYKGKTQWSYRASA